MALLLLGGAVYLWATATGSDGLFAAAVALVGVGLAVHLSDPVIYRAPLTATALAVAIIAALVDAALTAGGVSGPATALATVGIVAGAVAAGAARKLSRSRREPPTRLGER